MLASLVVDAAGHVFVPGGVDHGREAEVLLRSLCLLVATFGWLAGTWASDQPWLTSADAPAGASAELAAESAVHWPADATTDGALASELRQIQARLAQLESNRLTPAGSQPAPDSARDTSLRSHGVPVTTLWTAQLQVDQYMFNQDAPSQEAFGDIENGVAFRRARIGVLGDYGPAEYRVEVDFALPGRPSFLDVYAGLMDLPHVRRLRVGHFFEPFGFERLTPNRYTVFMERSLIDQAFSPSRNTGVMATNTYLDEHGTWAIGMFRSDANAFGDDSGDGFDSAVTGRLTRLFTDMAMTEQRYLHIGAAYSYRGANDQRVRFASQPEARLGSHIPNVPLMVDTGYFAADSFQEIGGELAWVHDQFTVQTECVVAPTASQQAGTLWFHGWYVMATCLLTGEYRPYSRATGTFQRVIPRRDFARYVGTPDDRRAEFGPGAWELAVRVSHLDLDNSAIRGGQLTDFTVGLNWYLNPYLRYTFNYIRAVADYPPAGSRPHTDIFGMRLGFDY